MSEHPRSPGTDDPNARHDSNVDGDPNARHDSNADGDPTVEGGPSPDRWLAGPDVLDAELPPDAQAALGRFLGSDPVGTLGEWADALRDQVGGRIRIEDLCLTDEPTPHWGTVDGDRHHFACFYDAVILAAIEDRPVDIRTESPGGAVIEAHAVGGTDLAVTPEEAVFSFGIDEAVDPPGEDGPTLERGYAAICPYVKAFPDVEAYERWAERVPAATVATPLAGATDLAGTLAADPSG